MIWCFLFIVFVHWFADFVLQTHHMSVRKSSSNYYLTLHVTVYTFATVFLWALTLPFMVEHVSFNGIWLSFIAIFCMHWITDYFTSRWTNRLYKEERYYDFFTVIGLDQLSHYIQLSLTFNYILQL